MEPMFIGIGTVANMLAVVIGSLIGMLLGSKIPERTRDTITSVLGLITLVIGGGSLVQMNSADLTAVVGSGVALLVVLVALLIGALIGSALRVEDRLASGGEWLRTRFTKSGQTSTFVDGFVTATLVFCVGPLAILGSLSDGLGNGANELFLKSLMDGFASIAFASSLGVGVLASVGTIGIFQGALTVLAYFIGDFLPLAHIDALTATGGVILMALALRLLKIKPVAVGDLLPALVVAPLLVSLIDIIR